MGATSQDEVEPSDGTPAGASATSSHASPQGGRRGRWAAGRLCASASTAASGEGGFEPPHSEANTTSPNLGGGEEQSLDVEGMTSSPSLGCSDAAGAEAVASVQTRASRWSKDKEK